MIEQFCAYLVSSAGSARLHYDNTPPESTTQREIQTREFAGAFIIERLLVFELASHDIKGMSPEEDVRRGVRSGESAQ
jgi:hypothetical protein